MMMRKEKNPLIIGRSVHNVKIEHQWRFVRENVVDKYRDLYERMKNEYGAFPRHNDCSPVQKYLFTWLLLSRIQHDIFHTEEEKLYFEQHVSPTILQHNLHQDFLDHWNDAIEVLNHIIQQRN